MKMCEMFYAGHGYMNGDIGKLSSGAVSTVPELVNAVGTATDYATLNGTTETTVTTATTEGFMSPIGGLSPVPQSQAPSQHDAGTINQPTQANIPLEQLKQMLSSQLEYYFSR